MTDTCEGCQHLREAAVNYYYCYLDGEPLAYEPEVDEAAWSERCPLDEWVPN